MKSTKTLVERAWKCVVEATKVLADAEMERFVWLVSKRKLRWQDRSECPSLPHTTCPQSWSGCVVWWRS